jgi:hypothetical protein
MEMPIVFGIRDQRMYSKKIIEYAGVDHNSNYLIVYFIVSYPSPQQKSLLLAEHICICLLISKTTNRKGRVWRRYVMVDIVKWGGRAPTTLNRLG